MGIPGIHSDVPNLLVQYMNGNGVPAMRKVQELSFYEFLQDMSPEDEHSLFYMNILYTFSIPTPVSHFLRVTSPGTP